MGYVEEWRFAGEYDPARAYSSEHKVVGDGDDLGAMEVITPESGLKRKLSQISSPNLHGGRTTQCG